jgi:4-amino-4-deoxy-L-arabinose transferase-like glycosyltransferase
MTLPKPLQDRDRFWDWLAVTAIIAGIGLRAVWVLVLHPPLDYVYSDMEGYVDRAVNLADGGALDRYDAFYPPGTHLLLAAPLEVLGTGRTGLWGAAFLWFALASITPFLVWRLARVLLNRAAAALAAAFCALWPLHVTNAGYFLSDVPSLAFLLAALWAAYRAAQLEARASLDLGIAAGLFGGIAVASRPQFLLNLLVVALPWIRDWRARLRPLLGLVGAGAVVGAVVIAHNSLAAGKLTGVSENSGLTFFLGHCDVHTVVSGQPPGPAFRFAAPVAVQQDRGRMYFFPDHLVWEQGFFFDQGVKCIRADGVGHVRLLGRSLVDMTYASIPWPQSEEDDLRRLVNFTNVAYSVVLAVIVIASLFVIWRRRNGGAAGEAVLLAHLACAFVTALVFFGDARFRLPYDVFGLALLAALLTRLFSASQKKWPPL